MGWRACSGNDFSFAHYTYFVKVLGKQGKTSQRDVKGRWRTFAIV
jgi:hypothetical protein